MKSKIRKICNVLTLLQAKGHRRSFPKKSANRIPQLLELVHSDVSRPLETPVLGGPRYFATFIDDFSK